VMERGRGGEEKDHRAWRRTIGRMLLRQVWDDVHYQPREVKGKPMRSEEGSRKSLEKRGVERGKRR